MRPPRVETNSTRATELVRSLSADVLRFACPTCGAPAGVRCRTASGIGMGLPKFHVARWRAR